MTSRRHCLLTIGLLGINLLALPHSARAGAYDNFFRAVQIDDASAVINLLQRGLGPNLVEETRGETGLMVALREKSLKVFRILLNAPGIELEFKARNGDTALMIAAYL